MATVRVTVPATSTHLGPGLNSMALALSLHNIIEFSEISAGLDVTITGEGADALPQSLRNQVVEAASHVFRRAEVAPSGLRVTIHNDIPPHIGLGSGTSAVLGGIVAANILIGSPFDRRTLLNIANEVHGKSVAMAAALFGGFMLGTVIDGEVLYTEAPIAPMQVGILLLEDAGRPPNAAPRNLPLSTTVDSIGRSLLVARALQAGNFDLLRESMRDDLHEPAKRAAIPGIAKIIDAGYRYGAAGVAVSGSGPALIVFAPGDAEDVLSGMARTARLSKQPTRTWVLSIDTQGISISEIGTFSPLPEPIT